MQIQLKRAVAVMCISHISHTKIHLIQSVRDSVTVVYIYTDSLNITFQHIEHMYTHILARERKKRERKRTNADN